MPIFKRRAAPADSDLTAMRLPFTVDSLACARIAVLLVPSYLAAWITGDMVWTIPTLAAASALAASLKRQEHPNRVDETDVDATPEHADVDTQ